MVEASRDGTATSGKTALEVASIPDILSFFGIGAPSGITSVTHGIANHNYVVGTDQGEYVVRFLVAQPPETVENDLAIQLQLRKARVGTPQYLKNGAGACLYRGQDDVTAVLSGKIDGVTPSHMSVTLASDIGRHLAVFHTSVVALPRANHAGLMNPGVASVSSEGARKLLDRSLPRGIIHGDLHSGNVLVDPLQPDRVTAVLDFEEAGENLYLIDLAVTLMSLSSSPSKGSIDPELMRAAKQGYEGVRKLTDEEDIHLPDAIRYASEAWINWFQTNGFDQYARHHQARYESFERVLGDHVAL